MKPLHIALAALIASAGCGGSEPSAAPAPQAGEAPASQPASSSASSTNPSDSIAVPPSLPAGFVYPSVIRHTHAMDAENATHLVSLTADEKEKVVEFFRKALSSNGYKLDGVTDAGSGVTVVQGTKHPKVASATIKPSEGVTEITVIFSTIEEQ
jgi:hypothetical protein